MTEHLQRKNQFISKHSVESLVLDSEKYCLDCIQIICFYQK